MTTDTKTASEQITEEVTSWPGVTAGHGDRGEFSFKLGKREIGHLHGDHALHIGFPKAVWRELYDAGAGSTTTRCSPARRAGRPGGSRARTTWTT